MGVYVAALMSILEGYLLGSISFSYLTGRILRDIDLREHGSGNLGASNTFRILGAGPGIFVLAMDALKGYVAVELALRISLHEGLHGEVVVSLGILGGLAAMIGHMYSVFLAGKGGKGVATGLGIFINLAPQAVLVAFGIWLVTFLITRYISLGSILAAAALPIIVLFQRYRLNQPVTDVLLWFSILCGLLVVIKHHGNIKRLLAGTENKFQLKK